jgi:hypothetical protein
MSYLFTPGEEWYQKARINSSGKNIDFDFAYNSTQKRINFNLPAGMQNDKIYELSLVNIPVQAQSQVDENVDIVIEKRTVEEGEKVDIKTQDIEGTLTQLQEKNIYTSYFKTSKYSTFSAKFNSLNISSGWSWPILNGVHKIGVNIYGNELFDKFEITDKNSIDPLIQFEINLNNLWYNNHLYPLIYADYPIINELFINWREPNI